MKKPKTKTHAFWCVVDETNFPLIFTAAFWHKEAIKEYTQNYTMRSWQEARKLGYTCQKFTITTKIK